MAPANRLIAAVCHTHQREAVQSSVLAPLPRGGILRDSAPSSVSLESCAPQPQRHARSRRVAVRAAAAAMSSNATTPTRARARRLRRPPAALRQMSRTRAERAQKKTARSLPKAPLPGRTKSRTKTLRRPERAPPESPSGAGGWRGPGALQQSGTVRSPAARRRRRAPSPSAASASRPRASASEVIV